MRVGTTIARCRYSSPVTAPILGTNKHTVHGRRNNPFIFPENEYITYYLPKLLAT
jgi:hypothetical protein